MSATVNPNTPTAIVLLLLVVFGGVGTYSCVTDGTHPEVCEPPAPLFLAWIILVALAVIPVAVGAYLFKAARRPN